MKIFLTGGTGFVGSHVAEHLMSCGHEVVALIRSTSNVEFLTTLGVEMVEGNLGQARDLSDVLSRVDAVVHVAGLLASKRPEQMYQVNVEGTRDLVDRTAEVAGRGTKFIYISSVAAQGPSADAEPRCTQRPPKPVSHYGRTKLDGEGAALARRGELEVTILRPPPVYGPRDRDMYQVFALANRRLAPVLGNGERLLSIIHAEDVARAVETCLHAKGQGRIYPIDDGQIYTWRDLGQIISEALGKKAFTLKLPGFLFAGAAALSEMGGRLSGSPPTFDRDKYLEMIQPSWVCGHDQIRDELNWQPKWDLAEGARQTAQWYRQEGWL